MLSILLIALTTTASAFIYAGNPKLTITVDSDGDLIGGDVTLDTVRVHRCDGVDVDYAVSVLIDPVAGHAVTVAGGDLCGVSLLWADTMLLDGDDQGSAFTLEYAAPQTWIPLDPGPVPVVLSPIEQTSGFIYAGNPKLTVAVD